MSREDIRNQKDFSEIMGGFDVPPQPVDFDDFIRGVRENKDNKCVIIVRGTDSTNCHFFETSGEVRQCPGRGNDEVAVIKIGTKNGYAVRNFVVFDRPKRMGKSTVRCASVGSIEKNHLILPASYLRGKEKKREIIFLFGEDEINLYLKNPQNADDSVWVRSTMDLLKRGKEPKRKKEMFFLGKLSKLFG